MIDPGEEEDSERPESATRAVLLWLIASALVAWAGVGWVWLSGRAHPTEAERCRRNLKQLSTALSLYVEDHDGRLPPAAWSAPLERYHQAPFLVVCPAAPQLTPGYRYNDSLSLRLREEVGRPEAAPVLFDGDAAGKLAIRHSGSGNVLFLDGRIRRRRSLPPGGSPAPVVNGG